MSGTLSQCSLRGTEKGFRFSIHLSGSNAKLQCRYGYGISVTSRQQLLEVLYTALGPSASETVHLGKEVTNIHHEGSGVKVLTRDGMTYFGDLVVGADGVHSIARSEMLRMAGGSASNEESGMFNPVSSLTGAKADVTSLEIDI